MDKYTPGPWVMWRGEINGLYWISRHKTGGDICNFPNNSKRDEAVVQANARLIVAAPDLLDMCRNLLADVELNLKEIGGCDHSVGICVCSVISLVENAKELLTKIEG